MALRVVLASDIELFCLVTDIDGVLTQVRRGRPLMLNVLGRDQFVFFLYSFACHSTYSLDSGLIYFIKDFPRGRGRIISRCDWPSDDQKICACENSFRRRHDTALVIERSACRPNAGCDNNEA